MCSRFVSFVGHTKKKKNKEKRGKWKNKDRYLRSNVFRMRISEQKESYETDKTGRENS